MPERLWFRFDAALALAEYIVAAAPPADPEAPTAGPVLVCRIDDDGVRLTATGADSDRRAGPWPVYAHGWVRGTNTARRADTALGAGDRVEYLPLTRPDAHGHTLIGGLRHAAGVVRWLVLDVTADRVWARTVRSREERPGPGAVWLPARVHVADVIGPYPALVADGWSWNGWTIARFHRHVVASIAADTQTLATAAATLDRVDVVRLAASHAEVVGCAGTADEWVDRLDPDDQGMYWVGAMSWTWQVSDGDGPHTATPCGCPAVCVVCDQPVAAPHDLECDFRRGSGRFERPRIPAQPVVAWAHTHHPGCRPACRRPGRCWSPSAASATSSAPSAARSTPGSNSSSIPAMAVPLNVTNAAATAHGSGGQPTRPPSSDRQPGGGPTRPRPRRPHAAYRQPRAATPAATTEKNSRACPADPDRTTHPEERKTDHSGH